MTETTNRMNFFTATLHMELSEMKEAEDIYRGLLKRNPENWMYYRKIEECLRLGNSFFIYSYLNRFLISVTTNLDLLQVLFSDLRMRLLASPH